MTEQQEAFLEGVFTNYVKYKGPERLTQDEWNLQAIESYYFLQYLTTNRFGDILLKEEYKNQVEFALIGISDLDFELAKRRKIAGVNMGIKSESVKSHSITYDSVQELADDWEKQAHQDKVELAQRYLLSTGIFYRGM